MTDSDFDEFSDGDNKANSEDSGSTKNSGPSHHVVTVTTGGGTGVNGFLSGSPGGEFRIFVVLNLKHELNTVIIGIEVDLVLF